jgi:hypothetical protein
VYVAVVVVELAVDLALCSLAAIARSRLGELRAATVD